MLPKTPPSTPGTPRSVDILAFPDVQLLDVAGPMQVFASANEQADGGGPPPYAVQVLSPGGAAVAATAGLCFATAPLPAPDTAVDTLLIAGGRGVMQAATDAAVVAWLRQRAEHARRVASVCTGAFLLGAAGLLDGRRAATHWDHCRLLARRYPRIRVEPDPIFVRDGPVWTSAGVTAGIDLALALVEEDLGRAAALAVARRLVVYLKRPGGQAQFSTALTLQSGDDRFAALHDWINAHLGDALPLDRLAAQAGMSERSFSRHYQRSTGLTPVRAVERLRVEAARHLVADTQLSFKLVAVRCGFGSEETMRRSFLRVQGVGPQEFRARFAA